MDSQNRLRPLAPVSDDASRVAGLDKQSADSEALTIPEKVIHFLTERMPNSYCDDCLAEALHLRRSQVNTVTATLGLCREYSRGEQSCRLCVKATKSATRRISV